MFKGDVFRAEMKIPKLETFIIRKLLHDMLRKYLAMYRSSINLHRINPTLPDFPYPNSPRSAIDELELYNKHRF